MTFITFDTLKYANRLKRAGINPTHAEAEAEALSEVFESHLCELVTKSDLHLVKSDLHLVKSDLQKEIRELELCLTMRMAAMSVTAVGLIAALMKVIL